MQRVVKARDYSKVHACYYCGKLAKKIGRHLTTVHRTEDDVKYISETSTKESDSSDNRTLALDRLRNLGDFMHNIDVLTEKKGILITARRLTGDQMHSFDDYLPCRYCMAFFYNKELWRHAKYCQFRNSPVAPACNVKKVEKEVQKAGRLILAGAGVTAGMSCVSTANQEFMNYVISPMPPDDVSDAVRTDPLLLQLGAVLYTKLGLERASDLRCRLRYLAKLKVELKLSDNFNELLKASNFDAFVTATKQMCIVSNEKTLNGCIKLMKPHIAMKIGQYLKKVCQIKRGRAIRNQNAAERQEAEDFLLLLDSDWSDKIGSLARQSASEARYNKKELLPLTRDLQKLKLFLTTAIEKTVEELKAEPSLASFERLATLTLSRLITFNKRRPEEPAKLQIQKYEAHTCWQDGSAEIAATLSQFERGLLGRYVSYVQDNLLLESVHLRINTHRCYYQNHKNVHDSSSGVTSNLTVGDMENSLW